MITIITGLPGNGKTLYALSYIKAYAETEGRDVYYSGISDLKLPWTEFKPEEWINLPTGAIVVIDEAQFVFAKRPNGSKLPEFYEKLATHRHKGLDIFIITQHPSLVDNFVRQLVGRHLHVIRKFGMSRATIYEWSAANVSPQNASSHKNAITHKWTFPKAAYEYYKSAEVHTVKRKIPVTLILAVLFIVGMLAVAYYVFHRYQQRGIKHDDGPGGAVSVAPAGAAPSGAGEGGVSHASYVNAVSDAKQFIFERTPRLEGLPMTAPRYDEITKPTTAPVPAACLADKVHCSCYSQQATPINVPDLLCRDIVAHGYFVDFDDKGGQNRQERAPGAMRADAVVLNSNNMREKQTSKSSGPSVTSFDTEDGYGVLGKRGGSLPRSNSGR